MLRFIQLSYIIPFLFIPVFSIAGLLVVGLVPKMALCQGLAEHSSFEIEKIGGGELYDNPIRRYQATIIVGTKDKLIDALHKAQPFDVIYVDDAEEINLSDTWDLVVTPYVTLASGRGISGSQGALLYTTTKAKRELLKVESGARVTGLRIKGPTIVADGPGMCYNDAKGIHIVDAQNVEIDNNEIYAWPRSGVGIEFSQNIKIHHNHFHHHLRKERGGDCVIDGEVKEYGLGYGVCADASQDVIIERNLFDHNRHDITSSGTVEVDSIPVDTEYFAQYNLVLGGAIAPSFDVHGGADFKERDDYNAGTYFQIHHNVFTQRDFNSVIIRGIPTIEAHINDNEFPHDKEFQREKGISAISQKKCSEREKGRCDPYRSLVAYNNRLNVKYPKRWFVSFSGESFWRFRKFETRHPKYVGWGDFNGDGKQDAFKTVNGQWQVALSGLETWKKWNVSGVYMNNLRFADLNGDGKTDVFRTTGRIWYVSLGGNGKWQKWNTSSVALSNLKFGDFNGDGKDDVFRTNGSSWYVSYSGAGRWQRINGSSVSSSRLFLGDFNGDGRADVFTSSNGKWKVSLSGTSKWINWNSSGVSLSEIKFADMNGDGKTDVFRGNGSRWYVSYGGKTSWQPLATSNLKTNELMVVDVNGDGKADVLSHQSW